MAKEGDSKKRKASVPDSSAEKMKKVKNAQVEPARASAKKRKATEEAAPITVKKSKTPKPTLENVPKTKPATTKAVELTTSSSVNASKTAKSAAKKFKPAKISKEQILTEFPSDDEDDDEDTERDGDGSEIDDQTEALLKGFESDGDEEDATKEGGFEEGDRVPKVPDLSNRSKKQLQRAAEFKKDDSPGVVYIGRIPHGFYEHEMRDYFKQFGTITKLRLSRNRKTGSSKHIAWIEFESSAVAQIVAKTMDNYLLFNHILKVKLVPNEQVPASLWKGANKRFKRIPWNKMAGRELKQPKSEDAWEKQNMRVQARRREKSDKLKEIIGYEIDLPLLKSSKGLAQKSQPALIEQDEEVPVIDAALTEKAPKKKTKKDKIQVVKDNLEETPIVDTVVASADSILDPAESVEKVSKSKKSKKSKKNLDGDNEGEESTVARAKKPKKSKKVKADA